MFYPPAKVGGYKLCNTGRKVRELENINNREPRPGNISLLREKFVLPCYIVCTYVFFNLASMVLAMTARYLDHDRKVYLSLGVASYILDIIGFISDACIYVFANRNVRRFIYSVVRKSKGRSYRDGQEKVTFIQTNADAVIETKCDVIEIMTSL